LKVVIRRRFGVELAERQIERILKQLKFARISVRPRHPKADEATQQAFKKTSAPW
jgi:transposase